MKNTIQRIFNNVTTIRHMSLSCLLLLCTWFSSAQVTSSIDSTSIKIGEQITYKIEVESDTTDLVLFPEGQTFLPLEVIESYNVDTTKKDAKYRLIKEYGLTQFDSGSYTIPRQKITIGDRSFFTDSLRVEVNEVQVDTTKQKLFDIKPIIEVDKSLGDWWKYLLVGLLILGLVAFLVYWFVWRVKPLTEEEKIAQLKPYERAKLALQELDNSHYLEHDEIKSYYSELTLIIRKYLDEKVYDHALESTTEELVNRLRLLKDGNQIDLDRDTIKNIETIFRRADLVKFAKSKPDIELAKLDRNTIDLEIDHVKESLPEPTEEELLADLEYREELARKKKRKQIIITSIVGVLLLIATYIGFSLHYGFGYVKDTILGNDSKELLETKEWIRSEYGAPGITITTPIVLQREVVEMSEAQKEIAEVAVFNYTGIDTPIDVLVTSTKFKPVPHVNEKTGKEENKIPEIDLNQVASQQLLVLEQNGAENIIPKNEQFITPNGQEGLKTFGTGDFKVEETGVTHKGNYIILGFTAENMLQQVILIWKQDDEYADQIIDRILNSIELITLEDEEDQ